MSADYEDVSPAAAVLAVHGRHVSFLREALLRIRQELELRSEPYGSPQYKESLASEKGTVAHHYALNSHHPEFEADAAMGWLDLIEMVCDWNAAAKTYGKQDLRASIEVHRNRFDFTDEQWWLIEEVAAFLEIYRA